MDCTRENINIIYIVDETLLDSLSRFGKNKYI